MQIKLTVRGGKNDGAIIVINKATFVIGRSPECHLRINSGAISRQHAVITVDSDLVRVKDLGSTNGTYINGQKITQETVLHNHDLLQLGPLQTVVVFSENVPRPSDDSTARNQGVTQPRHDQAQSASSETAGDEIDLSALFEEDSAQKAAEFQQTITNIMDWKKMAEEEGLDLGAPAVSEAKPNAPDSRDAASKALEAMFRNSVKKK